MNNTNKNRFVFMVILHVMFISACNSNIDKNATLSVKTIYQNSQNSEAEIMKNGLGPSFIIMFEGYFKMDTVQIQNSDSVFMREIIQTDESTGFASGIGLEKSHTANGIYFVINELQSQKVHLDSDYTYVLIKYDPKMHNIILEYSNEVPIYR